MRLLKAAVLGLATGLLLGAAASALYPPQPVGLLDPVNSYVQ